MGDTISYPPPGDIKLSDATVRNNTKMPLRSGLRHEPSCGDYSGLQNPWLDMKEGKKKGKEREKKRRGRWGKKKG